MVTLLGDAGTMLGSLLNKFTQYLAPGLQRAKSIQRKTNLQARRTGFPSPSKSGVFRLLPFKKARGPALGKKYFEQIFTHLL